jgi:hypothetical protein
MLFLVFYYLLAAVLIFQGLHFYGEQTQPLGTVPEEVGQEKASSGVWGGYLATYGGLMVVCGLLSHYYAFFGPALGPLRAIGLLSLVLFGAWVVFMGRRIEFLGTAAEPDHGHH